MPSVVTDPTAGKCTRYLRDFVRQVCSVMVRAHIGKDLFHYKHHDIGDTVGLDDTESSLLESQSSLSIAKIRDLIPKVLRLGSAWPARPPLLASQNHHGSCKINRRPASRYVNRACFFYPPELCASRLTPVIDGLTPGSGRRRFCFAWKRVGMGGPVIMETKEAWSYEVPIMNRAL